MGIEMAAELKITHPKLSVSLVHSHERLLSAEPLPDDFGDRSAAVLRETGVELILNERVVSETPLPEGDGKKKVRITLGSGKVMEVGKVIWAISAAVPSTEFLPKEALNEDGFVKVTKSYVPFSPPPNPKLPIDTPQVSPSPPHPTSSPSATSPHAPGSSAAAAPWQWAL